MKLKYAAPPAESVNALNEGVRMASLNADVYLSEKIEKAAGAPQDYHPHEAFFIGLDDIAAGKGLDAAKSTGWRYIVSLEDNDYRSLEVHYDEENKSHNFAEINLGPFPKATVDLLDAGDALKDLNGGEYIVSVLRIPALYVFALWFKDEQNKKDFLVPLPPVHHALEAGKVYSPDDFFAALKPEAEERLKFDDSPQN